MTINKQNLSTSADGADIFAVDGSNSPFTNTGNLSTSGALASAIRGVADGVSINNKGAIATTGDGSPGMTAGEIFGQHDDNVTLANYGSISAGGSIFADDETVAFPDGIDAYGNHETLLNYGSITTATGDGIGLYAIGANSLLVNYGTISAPGVGMAVDTIDGTGAEDNNTLINKGQIHTSLDGSAGILVLTNGNLIQNYGSIQVDGIRSFGISIEGQNNHGDNYGTILATGDTSRGVLLQGEGNAFANYGTIQTTGEDSIGARLFGDNQSDTDSGTFTNYGKIVSAGWSVKGADANDHFVNHGSLVGDADMGAGDDSFVAGKGGSLNGELTLGDGNDLIVFEKGGGKLRVTDFVAGAGTDDVIDVSAFGFHSFAEVMAHASQSGADVVLKLGAKDQIVLENVTLGSLNADDFALGASGAHATGLVHHDLFGMA